MSEVLSIGCCFWDDPQDRCHHVYQYSVEDVHLLRNQVKRHLTLPHEFFCLTDIEADFGDGVRVIPLDRSRFPAGSRYPKLTFFRPGASELIGNWRALLDLDTVVVGNLDAIFARNEDVVFWRNPNFGIRPMRAFYNTSIMMARGDKRTIFWDKFDPRTSPAEANRVFGGTDQAWISITASREEAYWDASHGVYGAGRLGDYNPTLAHTVLPDNARIVFFPGRRHPRMAKVHEKHPWVKEHRW